MIIDGYWATIAPHNEQSYIKYHWGKQFNTFEEVKAYYSKRPEYYGYDWDKALQVMEPEIEKSNQKFNNWLSNTSKDAYYFFILTKEQYTSPRGKEAIDRCGLDKYIVYESDYVYNYNHMDHGPKLKVIIFHFPEGYSNV